MSHPIRICVAAASILVAGTAAHAQSKTVIDRNALRQMVQLSVAFTQARISFTSPPYPVQFVETAPFQATRLTRTAAATGPLVSPSAGAPNDNPLLAIAKTLPAGTYTLVATPLTYSISSSTQTVSAGTIPTTLQSLLPSNSITSTVSVASARTQGRVVVNYTFTR